MNTNKTITSVFIVPTLKIPKNKLKENGFINGFIGDSKRDIQYDNAVYLLFRPRDLDKFREFLDSEHDRTFDVLDDYDYEDGYVVVVYKLNPDLKDDFDIVKTGKYSKTSPAFKKLFPEKITINKGGLARQERTLQYKIFNRTDDMIKYWEHELAMRFDNTMEVWHGFDEEREILNIDKFKEHVQ